MSFHTTHLVRFDPEGQLLSEQRVEIPRAQWPPERALDASFIEQLADEYFRAMQHMTLGVFYTVPRGTGLAMRAPIFGDVLAFDHRQVTVGVNRVSLSWSVVGGAMQSRRSRNGGQIVFEAVEDQSGAGVTLIIRVEDYTTRLIDLFGRRPGSIVYHLTQGLSHRTLTLRFLREAAARLTIELA